MADELMRASPLAVSLLDRDLRFVAVNDAAAEINGLAAEDHPGRRLEEVVPDVARRCGPTIRRAIETDEAVLDDEVTAQSPGRQGLTRSWRVHWLPVHEGARVIGLAALFHDITVERQLRALHDDLLDRERQVARVLQGRLLPRSLPPVDDCEVATRYVAGGRGSTVGGDFYDLIGTAPGRWLAVIGDVGGKGASAAASTAVVRHTIRAIAGRDPDPATVLQAANAALIEDDEPASCTAVAVDLRRDGERLLVRAASAGHPPALIARRAGEVEAASRPGTLLGLFPDIELRPHETALGPGDALVLYTDGAIDIHLSDGRILDEAALRSLLARPDGASATTIAERIKARVAALDARSERDDLAVMVIRRRPGR